MRTFVFLFFAYQILWDNCNDDSAVALLFASLPIAHWEGVHGEHRDYGSLASVFSLLLLIAGFVWKASRGKCLTRGCYTQSYYPWRKNWDEKGEIIVKEPLPRDGIAQSLQEGWFPSEWGRLDNTSGVLVVRQSPVTSPLSVCVCVGGTWYLWLIYSINLSFFFGCFPYSSIFPIHSADLSFLYYMYLMYKVFFSISRAMTRKGPMWKRKKWLETVVIHKFTTISMQISIFFPYFEKISNWQ